MGEQRGNLDILREIVEGLGYDCVGVTLGKESGRSILRVYIDSLGGILVKDCETVSRALNRFLDENDEFIRGQYYLEVSSPGVERPLFTLRDYEKFIGKKIKIKTAREIEGQKGFTGLLAAVEADGRVLLKGEKGKDDEEEKPFSIPFDQIIKGNLVYEEQKKRRSK